MRTPFTSPTPAVLGVGDRFEKRTVTDTVEVGDGPQTVAADPSTHTAWVVNFKGNSVSVIER